MIFFFCPDLLKKLNLGLRGRFIWVLQTDLKILIFDFVLLLTIMFFRLWCLWWRSDDDEKCDEDEENQ